MSQQLLVFIDNISGKIITELKDDDVHTDPLSKEVKEAMNALTQENEQHLMFILMNMDVSFENCNFNNPITDAYTDWKTTWRRGDMDRPDWRRNTELLSYTKNSNIQDYIDVFENTVCAYRDPLTEDVGAFIERSNRIRSQIRISKCLNSIGRPDLQTRVTVSGSIVNN